jgi:hypothetical protein
VEKKGVIFVIDDKKEDWWTIFKGRTIGPRPELLKEFQEKTQKKFYMYQADRFLDFASKHFKQAVNPESVDEIRDLRQQDMLKMREIHRWERIISNKRISQERIRYLQEKLARLHAIITEKKHEKEHLQTFSFEGLPSEEHFEPADLERHLDILKRTERLRGEMERLQLDLNETEMEYAEAAAEMELARNQQLFEKKRITEPGASLDAENNWGIIEETFRRRK